MDEKTYRDQFEVGEEEISKKWSIIQSVFKVPSPQEGHEYGAWPRFPDSIFQESCNLALLGEDPFVSEFEFNVFRRVLIEADEDEFMVLVRYGSGAGKQYELFYYPTDVAWATFNDDNEASLAIALSVLDHYVVGGSGQWGMHWIEPWGVYLVGYKTPNFLRALQSTYNFEGRGAEVVDSLPKEREAKRLHEIADQIRSQESAVK